METPGMFSLKNIPFWRPARSFYARHPRPWAEVEEYHLDQVDIRFSEALHSEGRNHYPRELLMEKIQKEERLAALVEYQGDVITTARLNMDHPTMGHHNQVFFDQEISYYFFQIGELPFWW